MSPPDAPCIHTHIQTTSSPYAEAVGFTPATRAQRLAAAGDNTKSKKKNVDHDFPGTFPAPLILPPDDLAWDPEYPPQSFASWLDLARVGRKKPTKARNTIYVVDVPDVDMKGGAAGFMQGWESPSGAKGKGKRGDKGGEGKSNSSISNSAAATIMAPRCEKVVEYLTAFYHGFPVKRFPKRLRFVRWAEDEDGGKKGRGGGKKKKQEEQIKSSSFVGLACDSNVTRIRTRPCPDGVFKAQLNLNDLLDAAIEMLPRDAFAIALLVDHDLYEDEEDDFCCGRAYGGSRVCVVSNARYNPSLDTEDPLQKAGCGCDDHSWPASHCQRYVKGVCTAADEADGVVAEEEKPWSKKKRKTKEEEDDSEWPMRAAMVAAEKWEADRWRKKDGEEDGSGKKRDKEEQEGLWFSRVCRTVGHEVGHCVAMDHCTYYACSMQGTAGIAEDVRQPPYLCPVCLAKLTWAYVRELKGLNVEGEEGAMAEKGYVIGRYMALARYCEREEVYRDMKMFAAYGAWIRKRLKQLQVGKFGSVATR